MLKHGFFRSLMASRPVPPLAFIACIALGAGASLPVSAATIAAPTGVAATAGNAKVSLSWAPVAGAQYYAVYQSTASGGPFTDVTNLTTTSVTESGLANGTTYYYYVLASNYSVNSLPSATVTATPSGGQTGTLTAPTGLTATAGNAQVALGWSAVPGAQFYEVYRTAAGNGNFTDVANLTSTSLTDAGLANGTTYSYFVMASNYVVNSPDSATVSATPSSGVAGGSPGTLSPTSSSYNVTQNAGVVSVSVARTGGSSSAVSIQFSTANGTALAGTDYVASSGTLSWAAGDTSVKSFAVTLDNPASYSGTRTFSVALSAPTGGATLGSPSSATVTITGTASASACAQNSSSWLDGSQGGNVFDYKQYGNYLVYVDNWGNLPGQTTWANSASCWGANASAANTDVGYPRSYPHVTRGWAESGSVTNLSTPGTYDWTTKSGLGIAVTALTKAKMHWTFQAPTAAGSRWDALADIYFHTSAAPAPSSWPPAIDLQIIQSLADQVVGDATYYGLVASGDHASTVTIGGNTYLLFIDDAGATSFHQPGGHTITLFNLPTAFTSGNANPNWGVGNAVTDIAAVIQFLMQSNPKDDSGHAVLTAAGVAVTSPLIPSNLYLTAINAGWEIDVGATFINSDFCVAMQNEPDCP